MEFQTHFKLTAIVLLTLVTLSFQNCAKIGVSDASPISGLNGVTGEGAGPDMVVDIPDVDDVVGGTDSDDRTNQNEQANNEQTNNSNENNSGNETDVDDVVDVDDKESDVDNMDQVAGCGCKGITVSDVLLSIQAVTSAGDSLVIVGNTNSVSLDNNTIQLEALQDTSFDSVNLVLNAEGNKVLSTQNQVFDLKTPSGQTSGIKVHLNQTISLKKGERYSLELDISTERQIVQTKKKCIFKPVVKLATGESLLQASVSSKSIKR